MNDAAPVTPVISRRHALRILQILVTAGLVAALLWLVDWPSVLDVLRQVNPGWVVVIVALVFGERAMLNVKWRVLLANGGIDIGFGRLFRIQLAANALGTFLPGSIGVDAFRISGLWRFREKRHEAVAATLLDRISTVLATVAVSGAMVVLGASSLVGRNTVMQIIIGGAVILIAGAFFLSGTGRALARASIQWLPAGLRDRLMQVGAAGWLIAGHPGSIVVTIVTSLGAVGLRVVIGKCLLLACGVDVGFATLGVVLPVVWATTMLPISIGGVGVQDAAYVVLLGYAGISAPIAVVVSLLDHILSRTPIIPGALFWRDVVPVGHNASTAVRNRNLHEQ